MALRTTQHPPDIEQGKTYDDLLAMPDDGNRYELIFGEIVMSPSPLPFHQWITAELWQQISNFVKAQRLGIVYIAPLDVRFSRFNVVQPDILFLSLEQLRRLDERPIEGSPELVVEVLSPSNRTQDLEKKRQLYQKFGVLEYWIVDPQQSSITVLVLQDGRYQVHPTRGGLAHSKVLAGFSVNPNDIFDYPEWILAAISE